MSESSVTRARAIIADYITFLADAHAFWFLINGDHSHGTTLCSRFAMDPPDYEALLIAADLASMSINGEFIIKHTNWMKFTAGGYFCMIEDRVHLDKVRTELDAHIHGRKVDSKKRGTFYALRVGSVVAGVTPASILDQKDSLGKMRTVPPRLNNLRSKQRYLARKAAPLVLMATYDSPDLYKKIMDTHDPDETRKDVSSMPIPVVSPSKTPGRPKKKHC